MHAQHSHLEQLMRSKDQVQSCRIESKRHALLPTNQSDANAGFSILFEFSVDNCAVRKTMTELICEYGLSKLEPHELQGSCEAIGMICLH